VQQMLRWQSNTRSERKIAEVAEPEIIKQSGILRKQTDGLKPIVEHEAMPSEDMYQLKPTEKTNGHVKFDEEAIMLQKTEATKWKAQLTKI
jgi:hypothetical protein